MTTPREALKACPFCGGKAKRIDVEDGENAGGSCICCTVCNATGNLEFGFKENFVDNWNRRTTPATEHQAGYVEGLEAAAMAALGILTGNMDGDWDGEKSPSDMLRNALAAMQPKGGEA